MAAAFPFSSGSYAMTSCTLRRVGEQDVPTLSGRMASMDPWMTLGYSREGLSRYLLRDDPALGRFVVDRAGEMAGLLCIRHPWLRGPYIEVLAVFERYQRSGTATEILRWVEDQARPVSPNLWTLVSAFNSGARMFYRRCGFLEVAPIPQLIQPGLDEILLRKILQQPAGRVPNTGRSRL
jgi:diamine N-acetyltransferase